MSYTWLNPATTKKVPLSPAALDEWYSDLTDKKNPPSDPDSLHFGAAYLLRVIMPSLYQLQTEWMRSQFLDDRSFDRPLNGLLSDAAHKYWESPDGKLIVTSIFNKLMLKWVPVLFIYSDGTTVDHYEYHFLILIKSIVREAQEKKIDITDEIFAMVVDFSIPQCQGLPKAFMQFFLAQVDDIWTADELNAAVSGLLKGCEYYYQKAVTCLSHISSVIPPGEKSDFFRKCKNLLTVGEEEFFQTVADIRRKWPLNCMTQMTSALSAKLPSTKNAEEAMHATIYRGVGKGHTLFDGLDGLLATEKYYHQQFEAKQLMAPIAYQPDGLTT
ncbi:hypothetical protein BT96DRAFT_993402 [Gymnopus androsaceus JB14]|uniref:Uncharacterized protein n=1 Tax=Gymnopus androsaceus JB14 TaxID=1447944 RepID=A0A6A4HSZ7_9AGAR|nr:hypothetical protein BT96DRAFT_993402 [Gymnopus androsaceus JB14]